MESAEVIREVSTDLKREINRYLFYELSIRGSECKVGESWPFELREVRGIATYGLVGVRLFTFSYGDSTYFVEASRTFSFWSAEGMSIEELRLYAKGTAWIASHKPIDLDTARSGESGIALVADRCRAIEKIAVRSLRVVATVSGVQVRVLEGLFFPSQNRYFALIEEEGTEHGFVIGSDVAPRTVDHAGAAPWRRLVTVIGEMLESGELQGW